MKRSDMKQWIGGSELAAILGLDQYRSPLDVWLQKTGRVEPFEGNEATFRGQVFEDAVGVYMERELGADWKREATKMMYHPDHDWVIGSPDRMFVNQRTGERRGGELKTSGVMISVDEILDTESPKCISWLLQCQWYMMLCDTQKWELGWMNPFWTYHQVTIERNQPLIDQLLEFSKEWVEKHLRQDVPPEPINGSDAKWYYPTDNGETIEAGDHLAGLIQELAEIRKSLKTIEGNAERLTDAIRIAIADNTQVNVDGRKAVTYKANKNGTRTLRLHL